MSSTISVKPFAAEYQESRAYRGPYSTPNRSVPCIELAFTSWQQSSRVSAGMSSIVDPLGSLRYTCADERSSTWNLRKYQAFSDASPEHPLTFQHLLHEIDAYETPDQACKFNDVQLG